MSKSYGNAIADARRAGRGRAKKVRGMPPTPRACRRTDPGDPDKCPVWQFHKPLQRRATRAWVVKGCRSAGIGCLDCKQPVIDAIVAGAAALARTCRRAHLANPKQVHWIVEMGTERARTVARQTMKDVRDAMGLDY
jgi:tryptophanyl-tRNA synthetase